MWTNLVFILALKLLRGEIHREGWIKNQNKYSYILGMIYYHSWAIYDKSVVPQKWIDVQQLCVAKAEA